MATAYNANRAIPGVFSVGVGDTGPCCVPFTFTIPSAGFIINDTVKLALIPANSVLCMIYLSTPEVDTGANAGRVQLGDQTTAGKFLTNSTATTAAVDDWVFNLNGFVAQSLPVAYTAEDWVILKYTTAPSTSAVSGTIKGFITYNMNPGNLS